MIDKIRAYFKTIFLLGSTVHTLLYLYYFLICAFIHVILIVSNLIAFGFVICLSSGPVEVGAAAVFFIEAV